MFNNIKTFLLNILWKYIVNTTIYKISFTQNTYKTMHHQQQCTTLSTNKKKNQLKIVPEILEIFFLAFKNKILYPRCNKIHLQIQNSA